MSNTIKLQLNNKIMDLQQLSAQQLRWQTEGKKTVFTNGCFDIVHPGHVSYLAEAAALGDILVVGVNTDQSVRKLKGDRRPINDEYSRGQLLASMFFVDAVVFFGEDTPIHLINVMKPDVLVKGGDYTIDTIVGAKETLERGGEVKVLTFLPGYSSTAMIEKIKQDNR